MTQETQLETNIEQVTERPDLGTLPENVQLYIQELEIMNGALQDELMAHPGAEARGIVWADMFGVAKGEDGAVHKIKISVTQRSDAGAEQALHQFVNAVKVAKTQYKLHLFIPDWEPAKPKAPVAQTVPVVERDPALVNEPSYVPVVPVSDLPKKPVPAPLPAQKVPVPVTHTAPAQAAQAPATPAAAVPSYFTATKVVVVADGKKATVSFFGPGRKFADLSIQNWDVDKVVKLFPEGWADFFNTNGEYNDMDLQVGWVNSTKLNSNGKPYKNVVSVS